MGAPDHPRTRYPAAKNLKFDLRRALRISKIRRQSRQYSRWSSELNRLAEYYRTELEPRYRHRLLAVEAVDMDSGTVRLEGNYVFEGKTLARKLEHAELAAFWIVSIGGRIDELIHERLSSEPDVGYLLDAVASTFVVALQEMVEDEVRHRAESRGLYVRPRFSPGYHGWPLQGQRVMHDLLEAKELGIELTDGMLMMPRKSLSGMNALCREPVEDWFRDSPDDDH
jgi:hypothetical protein